MREKEQQNEQSLSGEWGKKGVEGGGTEDRGREREGGGRRRHKDRCRCHLQNMCNAPIDKRNQLLTATG